MDQMSPSEAAIIARALGDPTRLGIYSQIANRRNELFCGELGACRNLSLATVSHHLRVLTQAGLITSRRHGQFMFYRAIPERLAQYRRYLASFGKTPARTRRKRASHT